MARPRNGFGGKLLVHDFGAFARKMKVDLLSLCVSMYLARVRGLRHGFAGSLGKGCRHLGEVLEITGASGALLRHGFFCIRHGFGGNLRLVAPVGVLSTGSGGGGKGWGFSPPRT